jgi:hypothetical protein
MMFYSQVTAGRCAVAANVTSVAFHSCFTDQAFLLHLS